MIFDHEAIFWGGDLNYRIDMKRDRCISYLDGGDVTVLREADQLSKELRDNARFRLRTFNEAEIAFPPTYKYNKGSDEWDTSEKKRAPAWCDRILWRDRAERESVQCLDYRRWEVNVSDHRPV